MLFENVTLELVGPVVLYVVIGLILRTVAPYCRVAYDLIKETNRWRLPRFEPKYILPPLATAGVYVLAVLTTEDALLILSEMHPTFLILTAYLGEDVIRKAIKTFTGK